MIALADRLNSAKEGKVPRRRSRSRRPEILPRTIKVDSVAMHVSVHRDKQRGLPERLDSRSWFEVRGSGDEPVRDVRQFMVSVHERDTERTFPDPATIGSIIQVRPHIQAVVWIPTLNFNHAWLLAASGQLRYCYLAFAEPKRGSANIVNVSFWNEDDEELEDPALPQGGLGVSVVRLRQTGQCFSDEMCAGLLPRSTCASWLHAAAYADP